MVLYMLGAGLVAEDKCIIDLDCMELMRKSLEKRRVREGFYFPERRTGSEKQRKDLVI